MPLMINSNIASLNAQRQLMNSGADLDQASERLASGRRINSAGDDAAGLAIANRQTSQIRGLDQAIRNANDGISLIQTAEGALDETTNILQRMRELSIQSSNGIYSDSDRSTLDAEVQQLKAEIDRIAETTSFNGQKILDGSLGELSLQVGSQANETIAVEVGELDSKGLGAGNGGDLVGAEMNTTASQLGDIISVAGSGTASINGQSLGDLSSVENMSDLINTINERVSGVEASSFIEVTATAAGDGVLRGANTLVLTVSDSESQSQAYTISETGSMNELVDRINEITGGSISAQLNDDGQLQLSSSDNSASITATYGGAATIANVGLVASDTHRAQLAFEITDASVENIDVAITGTTGGTGTGVYNTVVQGLGIQARTDSDITSSTLTSTAITEGDLVINDVALSGMAAGGTGTQQAIALAALINAKTAETGVVATTNSTDTTISLDSVDETEISIDFAGSTATFASTGLLETNNSEGSGDSVDGIDISTLSGAQDAIDVIDAALEQINSTRADLGAVNNRLDFTVSNLSNVVENTSAARSRIVDADFAAETASLSRAQVLQQASQAMLAQANARPQQVLSLLN
ncbi:MAG: flagellin [Cellvibrionaceae bacterium]